MRRMQPEFRPLRSAHSAALHNSRQPRRWPLKPLARAIAAAGFLASPLWLQAAPPASNALPTGLQVTAGQASALTQGNQMTVRNSNGAILNWSSFNIGAAAGVYFDQASAASKVLNRVTGNDPTQIFGSLASNGQVWLLNPNGVLFGQGARVDVAGLVTSTLRLNDSDFLNGRYRFTGDDGSTATVRNEGSIKSANGGQVVLLGAKVDNTGSVEAPGGNVTLAAARSVELVDTGLPNLTVRVDVPAGETLNMGRLVADGGTVDVFGAIVNQQGVVQADTLAVDAQGRITLKASDTLMLGTGSVTQARGLDAGRTGGQVDLLGTRVGLDGTATVDVSGAAAGGGIRVGGGLQGQDRSVPNAQAVWFGPSATLRADATGAAGDGGRIILWSDTATRAYGTLSARGGTVSGAGGFVETSGGWLDARPAVVDVSSRNSLAGSWLLDPNDILITSSGSDTNISGGPSFTSTNDNSVITTATIAAALNAGTSVTVSTGTAGSNSQAGDILMIGATLNVAPPTAAGLTLTAHRDILIRNSTISSSAAPLSVTLQSAAGTVGAIEVDTSTINTAGGNVFLGGAQQQQMPRVDGSFTAGTFPAAVGYDTAQQSLASQLQRPQRGVWVVDSTIDAGSGDIRAVGLGVTPTVGALGLGVRIEGTSGNATVRGRNILLEGWATGANGRGVGTLAAEIAATQSLTITGEGPLSGIGLSDSGLHVNGAVGSGATLTLSGASSGTGLNPSSPGLFYQVLSGTYSLSASNAAVSISGSGIANANGTFLGGTIDFSSASSVQVTGTTQGATAISLSGTTFNAPANGTLDMASSTGLLQVDTSVLVGSGAWSFTAPSVSFNASLLTAAALPLTATFATTGATPLGMRLVNTTLLTGNGDVNFGAVQNVNSSVLGNTTTPARWLEYASTDGAAALSLNGSTIDAGTGQIAGGGANRGTGSGVGVDIFQSNLSARQINLAGRSDTDIGLLVDGSTLFADRVLKLDGLSAGTSLNNGAGLYVFQGSTLQVSDAGSNAGSQMALSGKNIAGYNGVQLEGGDAGSANETRIVVSGAALNITGDGLQSTAAGVKMTGTQTAPGGLLINALGATSATIDGTTSSGVGGGMLISYASILGPQATTAAPMLLRATGQQSAGFSALNVDNTTITTGGTLALEGDGVIVTSSGLTGENGLFLRSNAAAGTGPIQVDQSILSTTAAGAQIRIENTAGGAAVGRTGFLSGTGVVVSDSGLLATGAGSSIVVTGRGAASGGTGLTFARSVFQAPTISLAGAGVVVGDGVFGEDLSANRRSQLIGDNITVTGTGADNTATPTKVGVRLGANVELVFGVTGGTGLVTGDNVVLGSIAGSTPAFSVTGSPDSFSVRSTDSLRIINSSINFLTAGRSGTVINVVADSDNTLGGRARVENSLLQSGGANITVSGIGVRRNTAGNPNTNTTVREGAAGVFLIDSTISMGSGTAAIVGTGPSDGSPQAGNQGASAVGIQGTNSIVGGTVRINADAGDYGHGLLISSSPTSAVLNLQANDIAITARGAGVDPNTGQPYAAVRADSTSASTWTVLNPGTGLNTAPLTVTSTAGPLTLNNVNATTGRFTATAPSAVTIEGSSITAADSATITATGVPVNNTLIQVRNGSINAGGALTLDGTATATGLGVAFQAGGSASGSTVSINGTGIGEVGVGFSDNTGSNSITATSGALSITGRSDTAQGVGLLGGWTLSTPTTLTIDSNNGLLQLPGSTSALTQTFSAGQALNLSIAAGNVTLGSGQAVDTNLLSAAVAGMSASSTVQITSGDLTVAGALAVPGRLVLQASIMALDAGAALSAAATGDALILRNSGGFIQSFRNSAGLSALTTLNGRWVLLRSDPGGPGLGGLQPDFTAYNLTAQPWTTDAQGNYITPAAGNALGYGISTTALTGQSLAGQLTKVYDATTGITLNPSTWTITGLNSGDTLSFTGSNVGTLADKNVGTVRPVTIGSTTFSVQDAGGRPVFGYGTPSFTANVTPLPLSLTGTTVANKIYDGNTAGSFSSLGSVTPLAGDSVSVGTATATFSDKNVGTGKSVAVGGFALTGADAGNYTLLAPSALTADISALALTVTGLSAQSRVYDTTTTATLAGTGSVNTVAGDTVALAGTPSANFADKNVGTAKPVTVTGYALTGTDAGNYTLAQPTSLSADITPAAVTVAGLAAQSRVYDATTAASFSGTAAVTPLGSDNLSLAGTATGSFADKNAGTGKAVTLTGLTLAGADAGNYTLVQPAFTANVTPLSVALTGMQVADKVYDGTTAGTFTSVGTVTPLAGDSLSVGGNPVATFTSRNVSNGSVQSSVTVGGFALTGADAGNYSLSFSPFQGAFITRLPLTISGFVIADKVYDGNTLASVVSVGSVTPIAGDTVGLAGSITTAFVDKNAGTAKPVNVSGFTLFGADANNYSILQPTGVTANITPAPVSLAGLSAQSKVYDSTTSAGFLGTATVTPLAGDTLTLAGTAAGSFGDKNVGTAKPVALTGLSLAGADAGNYTLVVPAFTANIAPASLGLLNLAAANKTYDSTRTAAMSGTLSGVLPGDTVNLGLTGQFSDANVGTAKTVTWAATTTGADASNYVLAPAVGAVQANITPATLTYTASPVAGTVGQTLPVLTGNVSGFVGTDTLAGATTGTLSWTTAATLASSAGQYAVAGGGLAALNYVFAQAAGNATALTLQAATTADASTNATTVVTTAALFSVQLPVTMSTPTQGRVLDATTAFAPAGSAGDGMAFRTSSSGGADSGNPAPAAAPGVPATTSPVPGSSTPAPTPAGSSTATPTATGTAPSASSPGAPAVPLTVEQGIAVALQASGEAASGVAFRALDLSRLPREEVQSLLAARARYKQKVFSKGVFRLQQDPSLADVRACKTEAELETGICIVTEQLKQEIQAARAARATQSTAPRAERARRGVKQAALPVIQRKLALVVGINKYDDKNIPELAGSVPDARAVRQILDTRMGYETTVLENASREQIVRALNKLALEAEAQDSVIVYYAGHGVLVPVEGVETGYWLPSDVDSEAPASWLSNADIARMVAAISARQVMLVSDSCYSGQLVGKDRVQVSAPNDATELLKRRAAVVMSSGGDEPVADTGREGHSVFAWHFMRALEGLTQWQVGGSLYERVRAGVVKDFPQTPQYGASRGAGHQGNTDYLFERRELEAIKP